MPVTDSRINTALLAALLGRRKSRRRTQKPTGAVAKLFIGRTPVVAMIGADHVLRVRRSDLAALTSLPVAELEVLPLELSGPDVRLLLGCVVMSPATFEIMKVLSALAGELQVHQRLLNLDAGSVRPMIAAGGGETVLRLAARRSRARSRGAR